MNTNQLLTWGAIGFAAFAAWTIYQQRKGNHVAPMVTDTAGLLDQHSTQSGWSETSASDSLMHLSNLLGSDPFSTAPTAGFTVPDLTNAG